ncbi:MAG: YbaB/EbfC family nucleoid-associated protein [Desulfotomaculaceae bacterium]|nr:YbaB/EbfC family nucleoid-associated protein [Desulfotomaculaceae bacterium]
MGAIITEMHKIQQELSKKTVEISEGEGVFSIVMNGRQEVLGVKFGPEAFKPDNIDALELMVASAFNRAIDESRQMLKNEVTKLTGGMSLPNMPDLF